MINAKKAREIAAKGEFNNICSDIARAAENGRTELCINIKQWGETDLRKLKDNLLNLNYVLEEKFGCLHIMW